MKYLKFNYRNILKMMFGLILLPVYSIPERYYSENFKEQIPGQKEFCFVIVFVYGCLYATNIFIDLFVICLTYYFTKIYLYSSSVWDVMQNGLTENGENLNILNENK